jgi:RND family efflux transporter MFP subunit
VQAELKPVTQAVEFVGRIEAVERVDIRARITGFLQKITFKEGVTVKQGQVPYEIEPDNFEAAVLQARGALYQAQAKYANASAQRARAEELVKTSATSRAELDRQVAAEKAAQGEVIAADANLKTATINLNYAQITAPISGEIGRTKVTVGNVVGPDSGPLTTIVSRDPMYVTFPVSQREFLKLESAEQRRRQQAGLGVQIRFSDGTVYAENGQINFADVVEFAKERRAEGVPLLVAATEGARLRFRPVMMTSFAFILGLLPLVVAVGPSQLARRDVGTPVLGGMLSASFLGIFAIPALYVIFQKLRERLRSSARLVAGTTQKAVPEWHPA